ncbi:MAG: molybdopterin cofactor-binding domain-containing protein, partial [Ruthenibacterium sp.]
SAGDVDAVFATAEHIFEDSYHLPAIHHGAIETHGSLADYDAAGGLTVYTSTQDAFAQRLNLSRIFQLPLSRVRVAAPAVGGGFGGKIDLVTEPLAAALAIASGRPVRLVYTRREDIAYSRTRHEMFLNVKTAVDGEGHILAQAVEATVNAGAYAGISSSVVWAMCGKLFKLTRTANLRFCGTLVYTNTTPAGAMRGFGSPQLFFAQQRQLQKIANSLQLNPLELLQRNLVRPEDGDPRDNLSHGNPRPLDCLQRGAALFDWEGGRAEQEASRLENGRYRIGVGLAAAAHGNGVYGVHPDATGIILKLNEDGTAVLFSGCCDMGNGSVSLQRQLAAEILGLQPTDIACVQGDTGTSLWDMGNYSSRGTFVSGQAAVKVARALRTELLREAEELLATSSETMT